MSRGRVRPPISHAALIATDRIVSENSIVMKIRNVEQHVCTYTYCTLTLKSVTEIETLIDYNYTAHRTLHCDLEHTLNTED